MHVPDALKVFSRMQRTVEDLHAAQPLDALEALLQDETARDHLVSPRAWNKVGKVIDMIGLLDGRLTWFEKEQVEVVSEDRTMKLRTVTLEAAFEAGFDPLGSLGRFPFSTVEYRSIPTILAEGDTRLLVFVSQPSRMFRGRSVAYDLRSGNEVGLGQRHLDLLASIERRDWPRSDHDRLQGRARDIAVAALTPWIGASFTRTVVHVAEPHEEKHVGGRQAADVREAWWR
jgi:hypothetical protein